MGHSLKHFLCFYVLYVTPTVGLEVYTETLQLSLLLKGCSSALKFKLSPVGRHALNIFHSEKMDSGATDSEDSCDWGDSSEEGTSSEEDELDVKYDKE